MAREIVLDTETTGFDPFAGDRLVELAALEIESFGSRSSNEDCSKRPPLR